MMSSATSVWSCSVCTFEHDNLSLTTCDMCGSKRKSRKEMRKNQASLATTTTATATAKQQTLSFLKQPPPPSGSVIDLTLTGTKSEAMPSRKRRALPAVPREPPATTDDATSFFQPKSKVLNTSLFPVFTRPKTHSFSRQDIDACLHTVFHLKSLRRNLQSEAVQNALRHESQLLILATGGGKSLCYQLPACLLGGVTIVVSPLIALMQDQIASLESRGIPSAHVSSQQTTTENNRILTRLLDTTDRPLTLLYITPESIQTDKMRTVLQQLHEQRRLTMFAIDEAHCLSSWGHDFRPAYRKLTYLRTQFPDVPCMACTATATPQVVQDLQQLLLLETSPLLKGSFDRPNIFYKVLAKDTGTALEDMVQWIAKQHSKHVDRKERCSGIVYVHKRQETQHIAERITSYANVIAAPYHAGLKKDERNRVLEEWSCDKIHVAVATVAFGMGIDLAHVRYVVHWTLPKTVEGFYQEAGRAGRDGLPSHSLLYYSPSDVQFFKFLLGKQKGAEAKFHALDQMENYCTIPQCRRNALIKHFGGAPVQCNKTCDFCRDPTKVKRTIQQATIIGEVLGGHNKSTRVWDGGKKRERGDFDCYDHDEDEDDIARDWGDDGYMVGDLKVTGGLDYGHVEDPVGKRRSSSRATGFVKASSLAPTSGGGGGGFLKASAVLDRLERMEERAAGRRDETNNVQNERPARAVLIPEHFRMALSAGTACASGIPKSKPPPALTSKDHGAKAAQLRLEIEALDAERERKLKSMQAKRAARGA